MTQDRRTLNISQSDKNTPAGAHNHTWEEGWSVNAALFMCTCWCYWLSLVLLKGPLSVPFRELSLLKKYHYGEIESIDCIGMKHTHIMTHTFIFCKTILLEWYVFYYSLHVCFWHLICRSFCDHILQPCWPSNYSIFWNKHQWIIFQILIWESSITDPLRRTQL